MKSITTKFISLLLLFAYVGGQVHAHLDAAAGGAGVGAAAGGAGAAAAGGAGAAAAGGAGAAAAGGAGADPAAAAGGAGAAAAGGASADPAAAAGGAGAAAAGGAGAAAAGGAGSDPAAAAGGAGAAAAGGAGSDPAAAAGGAGAAAAGGAGADPAAAAGGTVAADALATSFARGGPKGAVGGAAAGAKPAGCVFDLTTFGAKPDCEISGALVAAWKEACASLTPSTILIPKGTYLLNNVELSGPCKAPLTVRIEAILKAPCDPAQMKPDEEWVNFNYVDMLTVNGGGTFDGQGATAWKQNDCSKTGTCSKLPNNLGFNFLTNALVQDITTLDSKLFQVNVLGCKNITFIRFTVTAPAESLNTDGIHIGKSCDVKILDSCIKTGDDCISIGDGSQRVTIERVTCGPGHGIAVGSLGKYPKEEPVIGVNVRSCVLTGTDNGVRIKTWPAGEPGEASDIHFENIVMNNVSHPVIIDQEYCPSGQCCLTIPSKVKLSNISFKNIKGTSGTQEAIKIVCSKGIPCEGVELANIDLTYKGIEGPANSTCANVKPIITGVVNPPACACPPAQLGQHAQPAVKVT